MLVPREYRARKALGQRAWKEVKDKERASRVAQHVRRAATLTAELAVQWEKKVFEVCSQPPGLHHGPATWNSYLAKDSPPRGAFSPSSSVATSSLLPTASKSLPGERGRNHSTGRSKIPHLERDLHLEVQPAKDATVTSDNEAVYDTC